MSMKLIDTGWDEHSRDRQARLFWTLVVCVVLILIVTVGFSQVDKDLRIENPKNPPSESTAR